MHLLARTAPGAFRTLLDQGWALACERDDSAAAAAPTEGWHAIPAPMPVAAALQTLGLWSLDGPARRFDAEAWWYRLHFDAPVGFLAGEGAPPGQPDGDTWVLVFEGLATCAEVSLNGEPLLQTRNMFRPHAVAVGPRLRLHGNELLIRFEALDQVLAERRPRPRWRAPMIEHAQLRWLRTTVLGRTPGWSPPAAVVGPWQPVWLERRAGTGAPSTVAAAPGAPARPAQVTALHLHSRLVGTEGHLAVQIGLAGAPVQGVRIVLEHAGRQVEATLAPTGTPGLFSGTVVVEAVSAWWPHTHGSPSLYALRATVHAEGGPAQSVPLGHVGFREVRVDRSDQGFSLHINGVPVFCRGACWTPLDILRLRADAPACTAALAQVRAAGMNMLRVAGTLVYEDEAFLDACDTAGVMLWQDLMFANMDYPAEDAGFLAEVDAELAYQMTRWQARPALAVVCGNSEVEQQAAMWGAAREVWQPALFHERIPAQVRAVLGDVPYCPSSAHGGAFPFQPSAGTASYYGVGAYLREPADASTSGLRFATECLALANIPADDTLARLPQPQGGAATARVHQPGWKARVPRDLGAGWDFDDVRDHYVEQLFGERADAVRHTDPARHLMLGRAASAELMAQAFTRWRRPGSPCGGALVLFLRDLWAGAGWGLLDDSGRPKSAFHALSRVLQPLHLGLIDDGLNGLSVHVVNEHAQAFEGSLELRCFRQGDVQVGCERRGLTVAARDSFQSSATAWFDGFVDLTHAYRFGPPTCDLVVATLRDTQDQVALEQLWFLPAPLPGALDDPGLQADAIALADGRRQVQVRSRRAARAVHFDAPGWQADDEYFDLAPAGERRVSFTPLAAGRRPWRAQVHALNARQPVSVKDAA
jgi:beta-mannosidase